MKYFKDTQANEVYGYDADQQDLIDEAIAKGWEDITGSWPPPPAPPSVDENKQKAMGLLSATDWVNQPDVRDTSLTPHLINGSDFDAYRLIIRRIAVTPIAGELTWPVLPSEKWSK